MDVRQLLRARPGRATAPLTGAAVSISARLRRAVSSVLAQAVSRTRNRCLALADRRRPAPSAADRQGRPATTFASLRLAARLSRRAVVGRIRYRSAAKKHAVEIRLASDRQLSARRDTTLPASKPARANPPPRAAGMAAQSLSRLQRLNRQADAGRLHELRSDARGEAPGQPVDSAARAAPRGALLGPGRSRHEPLSRRTAPGLLQHRAGQGAGGHKLLRDWRRTSDSDGSAGGPVCRRRFYFAGGDPVVPGPLAAASSGPCKAKAWSARWTSCSTSCWGRNR